MTHQSDTARWERIAASYLPVEEDDPLNPACGIINCIFVTLLIFGAALLVWAALA